MGALDFLGLLSDVSIAFAALYVSFRALRGYHKERQAETESDPGRKAALIEDAKTLYFSVSIGKVWILALILLGALARIVIEAVRVVRWLTA